MLKKTIEYLKKHPIIAATLTVVFGTICVYTIPVEKAVDDVRAGKNPTLTTRQKHLRECFVVLENGDNKDSPSFVGLKDKEVDLNNKNFDIHYNKLGSDY